MTVNCGHMNLENERCTLEANHDGEHTHFEYDERGPFIRFKKITKEEICGGKRNNQMSKMADALRAEILKAL